MENGDGLRLIIEETLFLKGAYRERFLSAASGLPPDMAWLMSGRAVEQLEQTSPHQLKSQLEKGNIRIIDVRTPAEWDLERIKWAEHFPLSDILDDNLPRAEKNEDLVLQCGSGYRSNIGASILQQAGYANVKSLAGGLFAWSNAGFQVVSN